MENELNGTMIKTAVVTDTNSGMSVEEGRERGIYVIPMPVIIDDEAYLEGVNISYSEVFSAMNKGKNVSTSQPSPGDVCDAWETAFKDGYEEVVYVPMSSGLSGSCDTANRLIPMFDKKIAVADNHRISVTLYESILDAKYMADKGMGAEEIKQRLEERMNDATIYITVDSIKHLEKSGRITKAGMALATLLKIRPVLTIQGEKLDAFAKVRGKAMAEKRMIEATRADLLSGFGDVPKEKILIGAAGTLIDETDIEKWSDKIRENFPGYEFVYQPLSCSIACHTGPGAFAMGFVYRDREMV